MASFRVNAAVLFALCAFFSKRVLDVGLTEALAEAFGLSEVYAYYESAYWPL